MDRQIDRKINRVYDQSVTWTTNVRFWGRNCGRFKYYGKQRLGLGSAPCLVVTCYLIFLFSSCVQHLVLTGTMACFILPLWCHFPKWKQWWGYYLPLWGNPYVSQGHVLDGGGLCGSKVASVLLPVHFIHLAPGFTWPFLLQVKGSMLFVLNFQGLLMCCFTSTV